MVNLVKNAAEALDGQGDIIISVRKIAADALPDHLDAEMLDFAAIEVADSGPGVPSALQEKIFRSIFYYQKANLWTRAGAMDRL